MADATPNYPHGAEPAEYTVPISLYHRRNVVNGEPIHKCSKQYRNSETRTQNTQMIQSREENGTTMPTHRYDKKFYLDRCQNINALKLFTKRNYREMSSIEREWCVTKTRLCT